MPDRKLGVKERAVMFALMAEARKISNPELSRLHGFVLDGEERRVLNDKGLVDSKRVGRPYVHDLTDKGWRWCADELLADRPAGADSLGKGFYAVLAGLGRYLDRAELGLADLFHPRELDTLEDRIRATYDKLATDPGDYVSLTDLRRDLNGATRVEVDEALLALNRDPRVDIAPNEDQESLTRQDRNAALRIGRQDNHLLSIGSA
ncbi:hypothetical protein [Actinophytocola sp.]|jgi:hypothetical protein|uniref:hypothetical protein n=1 Tax=Actinophytocola sp. TaxID=1872138 RepID=UPI002ED7F1A4